MVILGIETSCDDTGIAIIKVSGKQKPFEILSSVVSSQIKVHAKYGGVVPNLAAREHLKNIEPCLQEALKTINYKLEQIDLIAVTIGPGLIPSLLIGVNFAKTLAYKWQKPIIGINHIEGHIIAALGGEKSTLSSNRVPRRMTGQISFPAMALVVSGGHTQLVLVKKLGDYKIIGETRDDAAGECFDKVAKLLGLGYPGGPIIAAQAAKLKVKSPAEGEARQGRQKLKVNLPRPMINHKNYDFSFSGLKTAVLYLLKDIKQKYPIFYDRRKKGIDIIPELCCEVQQAIIDVLIEKTLRAAKEYRAKTIILAGGVAANRELRTQMSEAVKKQIPNSLFLIPDSKLCTDNGAMIAMAGYFNRNKATKNYNKIRADANLRLS